MRATQEPLRTGEQQRLRGRVCNVSYGGSVVIQNTTAELAISNPVSPDNFRSNASRTLPQAHRGITVQCRPSIDTSRGTSTLRMDEEPDTLERFRSAITALLCAVSDALKDEPKIVQDSIQRARAILADTIGPERSECLPQAAQDSALIHRGGLAPWQVCRVVTHIEAHLGAPMTTAELANLVRLSPFHFSRAFRRSFNDSPHAYIMRRRVERAQGLMLTTTTPLAQIAASCGLADQAHFTRLFRRFAGESPSAWRRARATALE
jgi:AraC family transcriptional regulator